MKAILVHDFLRFAATKRYFVLRATTVGAVALVFALTAGSARGEAEGGSILRAGAVVAITAALLIVPGITASVLADERKNQKIDVLRSSPISPAGIVFGRYLARLAHVVCVGVAVFPFFALCLLIGGVRTVDLATTAGVLLATVVWTSAIGIAVGAFTTDLGRAVRCAYGVVLACVGLGAALGALSALPLPPWFLEAAAIGEDALNPYLAFLHGIGPLQGPGLLEPYAVARHATFAACVLLVSGCVTIRRIAGDPRGEAPRRREGRRARSRADAMLARHPWIWLEIHRNSLAPRGALFMTAIALLLAIEVGVAFSLRAVAGDPHGRTLVHTSMVGVLLALDMIVTTAVGATVVFRDRDAGVEDVAFSTPVTNRVLAYAKVFGALSAGLPLFVLLIAHSALGVVLGDLRPFGALVGAMMAALTRTNIAAFAVTQGLRAKTPSRAILRSMTGVLFFSIGCCTLLSPHVLVIQPMVTERWNDTLAILFVVAFLVLVLLLSLMYRRLPRLFALRREDISSMPSPYPYGRYEPRLRV